MTPVGSPSSFVAPATPGDAAVVRERELRGTGVATASTRPFADVLGSLTGTPDRFQPLKARGAGGMFDEPPRSSGRSARLDALRAESRAADRIGIEDPRLDRAGVDARSDALTETAAGAPVPEQRTINAGESNPGGSPVLADDGTSRSVAPDKQATVGPLVRDALSSPPGLDGKTQRAGSNNAPALPGASRAAPPVFGSPPPTQGSSLPSMNSPDAKPATPAMQVAQVLTGRGAADSARGATPAPASPNNMQAPNSPRGDTLPAKPAPGNAHADSAPADLDAPELRPGAFDELVRSIRLRTADRFTSARLHLEPPELGRMRVDVRLEGDTIQVEVLAESERARDALQDRLAHLRLALEQAGVAVERLDVSVNETTTDRGGAFGVPTDARDARRETHRGGLGAGPTDRAEEVSVVEGLSSEDDLAVWRRGRVDVRA